MTRSITAFSRTAKILFAGGNPYLFFGPVIDRLRSDGHEVTEIKTAVDLLEALVSGDADIAIVEGPLLGESWDSTAGFDIVVRARSASKHALDIPIVFIKTTRDPVKEVPRNARIVSIPIPNDDLLKVIDQTI